MVGTLFVYNIGRGDKDCEHRIQLVLLSIPAQLQAQPRCFALYMKNLRRRGALGSQTLCATLTQYLTYMIAETPAITTNKRQYQRDILLPGLLTAPRLPGLAPEPAYTLYKLQHVQSKNQTTLH